MINKSRHLVIAYELDNAESLKELDTVRRSLESILKSVENYQISNTEDSLTLVTLMPEGGNKVISDIIQRSMQEHPEIQFKSLSTKSDSYFATKDSITELAKDQDIVVFCDSDCVYEQTFLVKTVSAMKTSNADVAFGKTYANLEGKGLFSRIAALAWQFPPKDVPYSSVWGDSRWANNFAVLGSTLRINPFPEINFERSNSPQIKIEGVLWLIEATKQGMKIVDTDASCSHHIFDTFGEFVARQFVHGVADVTLYKLQERPLLFAPLSSMGFPLSRLRGLIRLLKLKSIKPVEAVLALFLLLSAIPARLFGAILYSPTNTKLTKKTSVVSQTGTDQ